MANFTELKKTERKLEQIESVDSVINILRENINDAVFYIKKESEKKNAQINNIMEDNTITLLTDPDLSPADNRLSIYTLLDKYFEIDLDILDTIGPGYYKCGIRSAQRATGVRKELRLKVKSEQVSATNFMISRHTIEVSDYKIPTGIKVLLDQFHTENTNLCDIFKVGLFEENSSLLKGIRATGKIFYIKEIGNPETYKNAGNDFINADELMGDSFQEYIKKYIEKGYKSLIIAPIIYITDSGNPFPFAYTQMISKSKIFNDDDINNVKKLLSDLVNRIKDANTLLVRSSQEIVDLSRSGAKLRITDPDLKKYLLTSKGFVFNIVFKSQAPITIYGEIKSIYRDDKDDLFVGLFFAGHSSRKDEMKRYYSNLEPMIKSYKDQLRQYRKEKGH